MRSHCPDSAAALEDIRRYLSSHDWKPLRQSASVEEPISGWRWKLALALVPSLLPLALLFWRGQPARVPTARLEQRIEVVFIHRAPESMRPPPPPPSAPPLRRLRSPLIPAPPEPPAWPVAPADEPVQTVLQPPSAGDLLRQIPHTAEQSGGLDPSRIGRRGRTRLPGRDQAFVQGIHVRGHLSPEQKVQMVLGLVGLGRRDPCPDIQRHVDSALAAEQAGRGIDGELDLWLTRAESCPRP